VEILGFLVYWAGVASVFFMLHRLLRPLERMRHMGPRRFQFTLADWLCLIVLIQVWGAVVHTLMREVQASHLIVFDLAGWGVIGAVWLVAVSRLSAIGVKSVRQRGITILLIYPLAVVAFVAGPVLPFYCLVDFGSPAMAITQLLGLAGTSLYAAALYAAGSFVLKMIAEAERESFEESGESPFKQSGQHGQRDEEADPEGG
jgi:hypothetical protein